MTYSLRYQVELEEKLGSPVLATLFKFVAQGSLKRDELEKMSFTEHMDVVTTYDQCENDKKGVKLTLENMLDSWFENKLCLISPEESQSELLKILKAVCLPLVSSTVEELIVEKKRRTCTRHALGKCLVDGFMKKIYLPGRVVDLDQEAVVQVLLNEHKVGDES